MKRFFYGIQKKLLLYSIILNVVVILIFLFIVAEVINSERKAMESQYTSVTEKLAANFEKFYEQMNNMTEELIMDTYIQNSMTKEYMTIDERESLKEIISYKINDSVMYYFYVSNKGIVYSNKNVALKKAEFEESTLYKSLEEDYSKLHFVWSGEGIFGVEGNHLYVCRNVQNIENVQEEEKLYFLIGEEAVLDILSEETGLEQVYLIFSDTGELCCSRTANGDAVDEMMLQSIQDIIKDNELAYEEDIMYMVTSEDGLFCGSYHAATGFTIATFISRKSMNQILWETIRWVGVVLLVDIVVASVLSFYFSRRFSKPIQKIANTMVHFDNESLEHNITIATNTELDQIGNAYNTMLGRISELMDTVRKKENEVREREMESLLYQIHPHFLYNTLENIYMMARINKQEQIMIMVESLSKFLRVTLSNGREYISVRQELEHVRAYMEIQRIRNSDLFSYGISCDESLYSYIVPKMFLQPMVENSIKHGFADIMEGGYIHIGVSIQDDKLVMEVRDNGCGMEKETLQRMNALLQAGESEWEVSSEKASGGYGIGNVVRRLKLKYGDAVTLLYRVEEGTICRIAFALDSLKREREKDS